MDVQKTTPNVGSEALETAAPVERACVRSAEDARRWFQDRGRTVVDWAIRRGFNPGLVNAVLHGRRKCVRGQSHAIAVALGLKTEPNDDVWDPDEASGHPFVKSQPPHRRAMATEA
jgi:gp16 family phage-associated protein